MISYSAPAKVILSGEHAVVYGKPAIVCSIDLRLKFSVFESKRQAKDKVILLIAKKIRNYLVNKKIKFRDKNFDYEIRSQIPIGRGLGSSAALAVAASSAFLKFYSGREFEKETINNLSYQIEKYFHKSASGVDTSASCLGGLTYYRREFEFLKNISTLNFKIPKKIEDNLYLIDSGKPKETTAKMVSMVGKKYNSNPNFVEEILNDIEKTTKRVVVSLIKEDAGFLQRSLIDNEILLEMLGVVSKKAKKILKDLEPYGVGKITGGGGKKSGSGYLLFYSRENKSLQEYCKDNKLSYFKLKPDFLGVKNE